MLTFASTFRSNETSYPVPPILESKAKAIWAKSRMLMAPSWFTSGSRETMQLAVSVETLTLQVAPSQELPAGIETTNLATESEPGLTDTLIVLEKRDCPVALFVTATEIVPLTVLLAWFCMRLPESDTDRPSKFVVC